MKKRDRVEMKKKLVINIPGVGVWIEPFPVGARTHSSSRGRNSVRIVRAVGFNVV